MIANSLIVTTIMMVVLFFVLIDELAYISFYKDHFLSHYGGHIAFLAAALFFNIFAAAFTLNRKFFLKDAGQKLSHLDKQIQDDHLDVSAEIRKTYGRN